MVKLLWAAACIVALGMSVYPPIETREISARYDINGTPTLDRIEKVSIRHDYLWSDGAINLPRLIVQWLAVVFVTSAITLLRKPSHATL